MDTFEGKGKRRVQGDYNMAFKLAVVSQVEKGEMTYKQTQKLYGIQGRSSVWVWLRKHGNLDWTTPVMQMKSNEIPAQKIKRLERELEDERLKSLILNKMIDISVQQYGAAIRKKFLPEQLEASNKQSK